MRPRVWHEVYPQGTKEGDDEQSFFICLARNTDIWVCTEDIAEETGLSEKRVEEIIAKYLSKNMIFQHARRDDEWAYWERVPELVPEEHITLVDQDHEERIEGMSNREDKMFDRMASVSHSKIARIIFNVPGGCI